MNGHLTLMTDLYQLTMTDGPQILSLSLSPRQGLRMPSDGSAALWLDEIDQLKETGEQA